MDASCMPDPETQTPVGYGCTTLRPCLGLFRFKKFLDFDNITLSFLFDKYYPIIK